MQQEGALLWRLELKSGAVWHHFRSDHPDCAGALAALGLEQEVIVGVVAAETRPRLLPLDESLLIVLRGVNTNPGADPEDMVSLRMWVSEQQIVTARRSERRLLSMQDVRTSVEAGHAPQTVAQFVSEVVTRLAHRIGDVVDEFDENLSILEQRIEDHDVKGVRMQLTDLRTRAAGLRRYLAPQREALDGLYRLRSPLIGDEDYVIREQTDRTTRYVEDLDLARERAVLLQEELRAHIAEQQNQRMYVLAIVTAIFLPLSFLTGLFGMNVAGLPGVEDTNGFVYVMGGMLTMALVLGFWMKIKKWI